MTTKTFAAIVLALLVGGVVGYLGAPRDARDVVSVNVREGPSETGGNVDAVVRIRSSLIEEAILTALNDSDLPLEMDQIHAVAVREGYRVEARLATEAVGVRLRGRLTTNVHPVANEDGTVGVELSSTELVGARLPAVAERTLRAAVSKEVSEATRVDGYRVIDVETSESELVLYLALTRPLERVFD